MMYNSGCTIKVPGKLMIAGEYAVLTPGNVAMVVAVDRYIAAEISQSTDNRLSLPQLGLDEVSWREEGDHIVFDNENDSLNFIMNAFNVAHRFLQEMNKELLPFSLTIKSDLNDPVSGKKYGLGSSAAIVTSVIASILFYHCEYSGEEDLEKVFKLSAIAHLKTQGNGSGADVAAAAFGGWIQYSSYSASWLMGKINEEASLKKLITMPWPYLSIVQMNPPVNIQLAVGWTRDSVGTASMVRKIQSFQAEHPDIYQTFLDESRRAVQELIDSFESCDSKRTLGAIRKNREALLMLSEAAGVNIETGKIKKLCAIADSYGMAKSSGAGGGDCGIAFIDDSSKLLALKSSWQAAGIEPLNLKVSQKGCMICSK